MDQAETIPEDFAMEPAEGALTAHRVKVFIGVAVLVVALGYFAFQAFQSATVYYLTVGELRQLGPSEDGRMVRVSGILVDGSFLREGNTTLGHFSLTDKEVHHLVTFLVSLTSSHIGELVTSARQAPIGDN